MLDVHAPEHGIRDVREFLLHLFTITCGLLIALGLEAGAEAVHHRHQREQAETKIRQEIRANADTLEKGASGLRDEREAMKALIGVLRATSQGEPTPVGHVTVGFSEEEIPDAAWRTAGSTGVLEYMPYDEVERFADAYREQALLQSIAERTLEDYLELTPEMGPGTVLAQGTSGAKPTKEEAAMAAQLLPMAVRTLGHLNGILAAGEGTMGSYKDALK